MLYMPLECSGPRNFLLADREPIESFLRLGRNFTETAVLDFASCYGRLGLCWHNRFQAHGRIAGSGEIETVDTPLTPFLVAPANCSPRLLRVEWDWVWMHNGKDWDPFEPRELYGPELGMWVVESLSAWRDLSEAVANLWETVRSLRTGSRPHTAAVKKLEDICYGLGRAGRHYRNLADDEDSGPISLTRPYVWQLIADRLNEWLVDVPARFRVEINPESGRFKSDIVIGDERGCFPAIVAQLLARGLGASGAGCHEICSGCHLPFIPTREIAEDRRRYCLSCREAGIPLRDAARAYRERQRKVKAHVTQTQRR
jgi:hypothetical protein